MPDFVHVLNYDALRRFMENVPAPWVLKPRSMAGAIGIKKIHSAEEFWPAVEALGDMQSFYLLEQFVPGDIFHVDCIVSEKQMRVRDCQRLRASADGGLARRRDFHDADSGARERRCDAACWRRIRA